MAHMRRRPRRGALRWIALLAVLAALLGLAQFYAPRIAAAQIAAALRRDLHVQATVVVEAPLWQLAQGSFSEIQASARDVPAPDMRLASVRATWRDGRIDLADALAGRVRVLRFGQLVAQVRVEQSAVQRLLDRSLRQGLPKGVSLTPPSLAVSPGGIVISGRAQIDGFAIPYRLLGRLVITDGGQGIAFLPQSFEGAQIHLGPVTVLRLDSLLGRAPLGLRCTAVLLGQENIVLRLTAVPQP